MADMTINVSYGTSSQEGIVMSNEQNENISLGSLSDKKMNQVRVHRLHKQGFNHNQAARLSTSVKITGY